MDSTLPDTGIDLPTKNQGTANQNTDNTDKEPENQRDYPEIKETGYTTPEFKDLTIAGRSEVIIRALLNNQPCSLNNICNHIFKSSTDHPIYAVRHFLENYWDNIITHEYDVYHVVPGIQYDAETPSIYKLWRTKREGEIFRCNDCGETYGSSRNAKKHRQSHGHLNWGFQEGSGDLLDSWEKNSRKQLKTGAQSA